MINLFRSVIELFRLKRIYVDNTVFRLHYKVTVGALICFSIVVSCYEFFGNPIRCITTKDVRQEVLETFCWAHSTFSIPEAFFKKYPEEISYPGIENSAKGKDRVYHKYYQWVCFFLILQAILFFLPHYIWKAFESGRLKEIVLNLDLPIMEKETKSANIQRLVQYMKNNLRNHTRYFLMHVICEILNFINTIGQLFLINKFLGHVFMKFGIELLKYDYDDEINIQPSPMMTVFPKMAKCIFHYGGSGGDIQKIDTACVLPLNAINEKIYVFLWFWLILLAAITGFGLVYRLFQIFSYHFRFLILRFKCKEVNISDLEIVLNRCNISDWFVLNLLGKNLERNNFRDFMSALAKELEQNGYKKLLEVYNGGNPKKDTSI